MDEETSLHDLPREKGITPASSADSSSGIPRSSIRSWILLFSALVTGGWFLWPHYCHHTRVLTIEDRVQHILSTTPLIGRVTQVDVILA
jgi:hypothetical protein